MAELDDRQLIVIKTFRARKDATKKITPPQDSPKLLIRRGSLDRTIRTKNIKNCLGRSQKSINIHETLRKENIVIANHEQQKSAVLELLRNVSKKIGDEFFIVDSKWWNHWKDYVGFDAVPKGDSPGTIDNSCIIECDEKGLRLKKDIELGEFQMVPKNVWKKLHAWYGGGPVIARKMILKDTTLQVELFPLRVRVMRIETEEIRMFEFSRTSNIKEIRRIIASNWAIALLKCRLFLYRNELTSEETIGKTLQELEIEDNQIILMRSSDRFHGLSGKIMGLTNVQEKPTLVEMVMSKKTIERAASVKKGMIQVQEEAAKEMIAYIPKQKRVHIRENSEKAKLQQIAKEICLQKTPIVDAAKPITAC